MNRFTGWSTMFKEVLQIIPKLSSSELNTMEKSLGSRFNRIAKTFGKGIRNALTGGSIIGAGAALLQKALSPLKEVQEAIERTLQKGDDIATNAKEFGSSAGELAKLRAMGQSTGLAGGDLDMLIGKFQTAVAEAAADPKKDTSVRAFVGEKNAVKGFFSFMQGLQKLDPDKRILAQNEIFGEKQRLKMADFLGSNFPELLSKFAQFDTAKLDKSIKTIEGFSDMNDYLTSVTELGDLDKKAKAITNGTINAMDMSRQKNLDRENKRIADFKGLLTIDERMQDIQMKLETVVNDVLTKLPIFTDGINVALDLLKKSVEGWNQIFKLLSDSPLIRGIFRRGK